MCIRGGLGTASLGMVLDAAEQGARWETGAPTVRGATRRDTHGAGTREPCTLGAQLAVNPAASERVA